MIACAIKETRSTFIALTTQNPRVYKALQSFCVYTFPNHNNQNSGGMTDYFSDLAKKELVKRPGEFNPVNFIIKNLYDECLYPRIPEASNIFIDNWFMGKISADNLRTSKNGMFIVGLIDGRWRE